MHLNFFHMIFNLVAIAPLLERFESEFGTLVTLVLFTGPFGTLPGGIYTLLEKFVFRSNTIVMGARYANNTMKYMLRTKPNGSQCLGLLASLRRSHEATQDEPQLQV